MKGSTAKFGDVSAVQKIKKQLAEGVSQRRVGLISTGAPARQHSRILTMEGKEVSILAALAALASIIVIKAMMEYQMTDSASACPRGWAALQLGLEQNTKKSACFDNLKTTFTDCFSGAL